MTGANSLTLQVILVYPLSFFNLLIANCVIPAFLFILSEPNRVYVLPEPENP